MKPKKELKEFICEFCQKLFILTQKQQNESKCRFCSLRCAGQAARNQILCNCKYCGREFYKRPSQISRTKNNFCSKSCAATYNNQHKTTGVKRSKLESWLGDRLKALYPNVIFLFNSKEIIGSELDIYIPSLKLAFELNGIFHYEPIYGLSKLEQIQNNDQNKFQLCQQHGISLCIIDSSQQKQFSEQSSQKYLEIIIQIIESAFATVSFQDRRNKPLYQPSECKRLIALTNK